MVSAKRNVNINVRTITVLLGLGAAFLGTCMKGKKFDVAVDSRPNRHHPPSFFFWSNVLNYSDFVTDPI